MFPFVSSQLDFLAGVRRYFVHAFIRVLDINYP